MKAKRIAKFVLIALPLMVLLFLLFTYVVMSLWNWLTPALFGWKLITFWQAAALLLLCRLLFGGFRRGPGGPMRWRRRMRERWEHMTPEEREAFRKGMGRCGPLGPPTAPPSDAKV